MKDAAEGDELRDAEQGDCLPDAQPDERFEERVFRDPRDGGRLHSWEQGWWDAQTSIHHVVYTYRHEDGHEERAHLQFSMYTLEALHEMVDAAGFDIVHEAEDFTGSPIHSKSLKWVAVLRPRP